MDMSDIEVKEFPIEIIVAAGVAALLFCPWLLLAGGAIVGYKWYKQWRFKKTRAADKHIFFRDRFIFDPTKLMYLGTSQEGTIRWWFDGRCWMVPQAVDNGAVYWDKKISITSPEFIKHLRGFYEMGNEWPEYYKLTVKEDNKKVYKKDKHRKTWVDAAVPVRAEKSDLPRADYADAPSGAKSKNTTAAMASNAELMELFDAVRDLEIDATGRCPTLKLDADP